MSGAGIDVLLPHTQTNGGYLSDYYYNNVANWPFYMSETQVPYVAFVGLPGDERSDAFLLGHTGGNAIDMGFYDSWIKDRYLFGPAEPRSVRVEPARSNRPVSMSAEEAVALALRDRGLARATIGIERRNLGVSVFERLVELLPEATFVDALPVLEELRRIKAPEEIRRMEVACDAARGAHLQVQAKLQAGMTGLDIARIVKSSIAQLGWDTDFIEVHPNKENALLFAPNEFQIRRGESVAVDIGAKYMNYASDMAHNHCVGKPDDATARLHAATVAAFREIEAACRPGAVCSDLYEIGRKSLSDAGYPVTYKMMGHGLGRHVHEHPVIGPDDASVLEPGVVFAIEIPMYRADACWVQVEENFVVTDAGCRWLSPWTLDILEADA
jgi:Xaa-Pro aminopeptidase